MLTADLATRFRHSLLIALLIVAAGCSRTHSVDVQGAASRRATESSTMHPKVDFEHWATVFPIETFQKTEGPRKFSRTAEGDPLDLWKPGGQIIMSPADLCNIELVRKQYARTKDLGPAVPVDLFLWSAAPAQKPFLTKLGGVPHRESAKPWPINSTGEPYTFVAQYCFAESRDIVSDRIPDDVMLVFFEHAQSVFEQQTIHVEWSSIELDSPMTAEQCPAPSFVVPQLSGHIYRTNEYPESAHVFEQEGHYQYWLFPVTQATKIGREANFIQNDIRDSGEELLCTLNSIDPSKSIWPFIDLEVLPDDWDEPDDYSGWGKYRMRFADAGCLYFVIDETGKVSWGMQSY